MQNKAFVVIDIQNDITKNYKEIIGNINTAIDWAVAHDIHVVYIKHNNLSAGTRTFKPDTHGAALVPDMKIVSENIFTKTKGNALTSEGFAAFVSETNRRILHCRCGCHSLCKSTCYNMAKEDYVVHVLSDCITSYDKRKIDEMLQYYASKGCIVEKLSEVM